MFLQVAMVCGPLPVYPVSASSRYAVSHPVHRFDTPLAAGEAGEVSRRGPVGAQGGDGVHDLLGDQGAGDVVAVAADPDRPFDVREV